MTASADCSCGIAAEVPAAPVTARTGCSFVCASAAEVPGALMTRAAGRSR
eukprot:CAMPEP_0117577478 /NCGR_PEP_ID=MMETSP0784-20121206/63446_1 /TAXON_ID=39447 /ORGANISM="" /LENGTH=49 /DNA_ID= /DNA_START= /DNA_END= /DNA_ORIENTATION=